MRPNADKQIIIICPNHGEFFQKVYDHLNGSGCPNCAIRHNTYTMEQFLIRANSTHGDSYDYSKVDLGENPKRVTLIVDLSYLDSRLTGGQEGNVDLDSSDFAHGIMKEFYIVEFDCGITISISAEALDFK